jgi:hypothetical protein
MMYLLHLKKGSMYYPLGKVTFKEEIRPGMSILFSAFDLHDFKQMHCELEGMSPVCIVKRIYQDGDMGGIFLSEWLNKPPFHDQ